MKTRLSKLLSKLLLGKVGGAMPFNAINSLRGSKIDTRLRKDLSDFHQIHPADCFDYSQDPGGFPDWMIFRFVLEEKRVVGLRNATVYPRSGGVVSARGKVLVESLGSLYKAMTYSGFVQEAARYRWRVQRNSIKVVVSGMGGFYHWMFEGLPGVLRCLARHPDHKILLPSSRRPRFVDESLFLALGSQWKVRTIFSDSPLRVDEAVYYTKSNGAQFVHPKDLELLRTSLLTSGERTTSGKRLYISRQKAKARSCDETPVITKFRDFGFKIIQLETMPLSEQIALFSEASHVGGYHGAGFSHGLFPAPGTRFLELFRQDSLNDCYARLLRMRGHSYKFLVSQPSEPNRFPELSKALDTLTEGRSQ